MNKRIAKKKAKAILKQEKPFISAKEIKAISRAKLIDSLRAPEQYQGKLQERGDYYAAIKKYHDYINKGFIRESSILDKYESADAFVKTLSRGEMDALLAEGAIKERHIQQTLAKKAEEFEKFAKMIDF